MKKLYSLLFAASILGTAHAQITLDAATFAHVNITSDTFGEIDVNEPMLTPSSTTQFFDFNGIGYKNIRYYSIQSTGSNAAFPDATYWEMRGYKQGADSFDTKRWSGITSAGIIRYGEEIDRQVIKLNGVPGGTANDSIEVLQQNAAYSSDYKLIPFPTTYGDSWNNDFTYEVNMLLTYAAGSYDQESLKLVSHVKYGFSAVGFGHFEMIKLDEGFGQAEVLMVRVTSETVDSFFLNGSPAPDALLTKLGITQGRVSKIYFDELFRENEVTPLVLYNYGSDATFSNLSSSQIHQLRIPFATSVGSLTKAWYPKGNEVLLYPNVLTAGNEASLYLPNARTGKYTYTITSADGRVINRVNHPIEQDGKAIINVPMPDGMINGSYWLTLFNENGKQIAVRPLRYTAE